MPNTIRNGFRTGKLVARPDHVRLRSQRKEVVLPPPSVGVLGELVKQATRATLFRHEGDSVIFMHPPAPPPSLGRLAAYRRAPRRPKSDLFTITLVSYDFKLCISFDVERNPVTWRYYHDSDFECAVADFMERLNLLIGDLGRRLSSNFQHIGISTPARLDGACTLQLKSLAPNHEIVQDVLVAESFKARQVISMYVNQPFILQPSITERPISVVQSELEFF